MEHLNKTELFNFHKRRGGRLIEFAGYRLPVQYRAGIILEHLATRFSAGLFDVSHMGQILIRPLVGGMGEAALHLERLMPADLVALPVGRQRYSFLTSESGGIIDDLMIARNEESFLLVVNAARTTVDLDCLQAALAGTCSVEKVEDRSLIAVQGPASEAVMARIAPTTAKLEFMDARETSLAGATCWISRSGYTGEDGFEVSIPKGKADMLAELLLDGGGVIPAGLGARDTLRLEAGLCLYGQDIDLETSPVEAGLTWAIAKSRRFGGARPGGFPGAERILSEIERGCARRRVGIEPEGPVPMRRGTRLYSDATGHFSVGAVTSGGFGPSLNRPLSMGYVARGSSIPGTRIYAAVRNRILPARVAPLPFIESQYKKRKDSRNEIYQGA